MNNIDVSSLSDNERKLLGYACSLDFKAFIAVCLRDQLNYPFSPFHDFICDLITHKLGSRMRYVVAAPRGFGKSSIITEAAALWLICRREYISLSDRDPRNKNYIIVISDTIDQAVEHLANVKELLVNNDTIRMLFPNASGEGRVWKSDMIVSRSGVVVRSLGTTSKIRGRRFGFARPDLVLADDIENLEMVQSESMRNYLYEWFTRDVLKAVDPERSDVIVVGTIISKNALLYKLFHSEEFAGWDGRKFKAIISWPKRMDLWDAFGEIIKDRRDPNRFQKAMEFYEAHKEEMDEGAEILWPQRFTLVDHMTEFYLEGKKTFMLERQNEVVEDVDRVFEIDKYYYYQDEELEEIPKSRLLFYMYVDPATGKKKGRSRKQSTDMFACVVIAKDIGTNVYYLIDYYADIISPNRQFAVIKKFINTYPIYRFFVESNTSQFYYYESLRDWLLRSGIHRPIPRPHVNKENKERRIEALAPYLENWTLRLSPNHRQMIRDLEDYPAVEYDDLLDCLSSCFFNAYKQRRLVIA